MIKEIKSIPLATFLSQLGHEPTMRKGTRLWYLSPLRQEHTPSFKVETTLNCWYDSGIGIGGHIIDLATETIAATPPSATTSTPSYRNTSKSRPPTSKSGASSNSEYRCTTAPGDAAGQFPNKCSELGKQGCVSGLLFLRKLPRNCAAHAALCFPHCNHIKQFNE